MTTGVEWAEEWDSKLQILPRSLPYQGGKLLNGGKSYPFRILVMRIVLKI